MQPTISPLIRANATKEIFIFFFFSCENLSLLVVVAKSLIRIEWWNLWLTWSLVITSMLLGKE